MYPMDHAPDHAVEGRRRAQSQAFPTGTSSVSGHAYFDSNFDGTCDGNESGVAGVSAFLFTCDDHIVRTARTDAKGYYFFEEMLAGEYYIAIPKIPMGYELSSKWIGLPFGLYLYESAVDPATRHTRCFDVKEGEDKKVSFGLTFDGPSHAPTTTSPTSGATLPPSKDPSVSPSKSPETSPSRPPTGMPSDAPSTKGPSATPSESPAVTSPVPTEAPIANAIAIANPTAPPTEAMSGLPTPMLLGTTSPPSREPSALMSQSPETAPPSLAEVTPAPSNVAVVISAPSMSPTSVVTLSPSREPSVSPSKSPEPAPPSLVEVTSASSNVTVVISAPSMSPTSLVTLSPSEDPSASPSKSPDMAPPRPTIAPNDVLTPAPSRVAAPSVPTTSVDLSGTGDSYGSMTINGLTMTIRGIGRLEDEEVWSEATSNYIMSYFNSSDEDLGAFDVTASIQVTNQTGTGANPLFPHVNVTYDQTSSYKTADGEKYDHHYVATEPFSTQQGLEGYFDALRMVSPYYEDALYHELEGVNSFFRPPKIQPSRIKNKTDTMKRTPFNGVSRQEVENPLDDATTNKESNNTQTNVLIGAFAIAGVALGILFARKRQRKIVQELIELADNGPSTSRQRIDDIDVENGTPGSIAHETSSEKTTAGSSPEVVGVTGNDDVEIDIENGLSSCTDPKKYPIMIPSFSPVAEGDPSCSNLIEDSHEIKVNPAGSMFVSALTFAGEDLESSSSSSRSDAGDNTLESLPENVDRQQAWESTGASKAILQAKGSASAALFASKSSLMQEDFIPSSESDSDSSDRSSVAGDKAAMPSKSDRITELVTSTLILRAAREDLIESSSSGSDSDSSAWISDDADYAMKPSQDTILEGGESACASLGAGLLSSKSSLMEEELDSISSSSAGSFDNVIKNLIGSDHGIESFELIVPPGPLGLHLATPGSNALPGPVFVLGICEKSPLIKCVQPGDKIIAIDDEDAREMTMANVMMLFRSKRSNPERKITILRDNLDDGSLSSVCINEREPLETRAPRKSFLEAENKATHYGDVAASSHGMTMNLVQEGNAKSIDKEHVIEVNHRADDLFNITPSASAIVSDSITDDKVKTTKPLPERDQISASSASATSLEAGGSVSETLAVEFSASAAFAAQLFSSKSTLTQDDLDSLTSSGLDSSGYSGKISLESDDGGSTLKSTWASGLNLEAESAAVLEGLFAPE